jgi:hypothetical protein
MILKLLLKIAGKLKTSLLDLLPILVVISFFQIVVLQQPFPNLTELFVGLGFVVLGLMLFVEGLEIGLFPIGENLSFALAKKGSLFWLLFFAFLLGFSTTVAFFMMPFAPSLSLSVNNSNFSGFTFSSSE